MKIKGLVTDRAKALIKLGDEEYLGVFSMPDLFHFTQELAKAVGAKIGKKRKKAADNLLKSNNLEDEELSKEYEQVNEIYKKYRQEIEQINKTVHPFNEMDIWAEKQEIEKEKIEQESIKGEQERCKEELATRIMAKNRLIDETKGDEELYKKILEQALNDKSQVSSMISAISSGASPISIGLPFSGARAGQRVYTGEPIARLGNTGFSSGPHVHFGVYQYGRDIDPMPLLSVNAFSFPVPGAKITQDFFGSYSHRGRGWPGGIDFAAAEGTPVRAAKNGVIIFDGVGKNGISSGFGHYIIIDHQNGFLTLYGHLK